MARPRRPTVKQLDCFFAVYNPLVASGLEAMGATVGEGGYYYLLPTRYGPLRVTAVGGERFLGGKPSTLAGVHASFVNLSPQLPSDVNPHSGKWNHYFDLDSHLDDPESAAVWALSEVARVVTERQHAALFAALKARHGDAPSHGVSVTPAQRRCLIYYRWLAYYNGPRPRWNFDTRVESHLFDRGWLTSAWSKTRSRPLKLVTITTEGLAALG